MFYNTGRLTVQVSEIHCVHAFSIMLQEVIHIKSLEHFLKPLKWHAFLMNISHLFKVQS